MAKRIEWIDMCKGVVMILTVYMHSWLSTVPYVNTFVNIFYMPLFFMVSGLFTRPEKYHDIKTFITHRWYTLYRPFLIFFLIVMILAKPFRLPQLDGGEYVMNVIKFGCGGYALWFIPVLSVAEILNYLLAWKYQNILKRLIIIILFAALGYLASCFSLLPYWNVFFIPAATLFYYVGFLSRDFLLRAEKEWSNIQIILGITFLLFITAGCFSLPVKPEWFINKLVSPFIYPLAISGSLGVILLCVAIYHMTGPGLLWLKSLFVYVGKNTFIILAFHQILMQLLHSVGLQSGLIIRILMWMILLLLVEIINRFFPQLLGRQMTRS